jgi:hypothetical protein
MACRLPLPVVRPLLPAKVGCLSHIDHGPRRYESASLTMIDTLFSQDAVVVSQNVRTRHE